MTMDLDTNIPLYGLVAVLVGFLFKMNSRLVVIETKFAILDELLAAVVPGYSRKK